MPNRWHRVKGRDTPEKFGVWQFERAMWKVGGIAIEHAKCQRFFSAGGPGLVEVSIFLENALYVKIFSLNLVLG